MKETFVLRKENRISIDKMNDDDAGVLFKAILAHADGMAVDLENAPLAVQLLFPLISAQIDRADAAYQETCDKRAAAGRAGGQAKLSNAKQSQAKLSNAKQSQAMLSNAKHSEPDPDSDYEPDIEDRKAPTEPKERSSRFTPPTVEEVESFAEENGLQLDPEAFVDFYASKGWKVGNAPMKDWKAAARNWARRDKAERPPKRDGPKGLKYSEILSGVDYTKLLHGVGAG